MAWDRAVDDSELVPVGDLEQRIPTAKWNPQGGGVLLGAQESDQLEALWRTTPESFDHTDPTERRQAREAGYLADAVVRAAIEKHAEGIAERFYDSLDYGVDFVGTFRSYDLHLVHRQTGEERHVEVKGSSGVAETVELTAGEVRHAMEFQPTDLFVVSGIAWRRDGLEVDTSGGNATRYADWTPASKALKPVRYRYQVPPDGIEV